MATSADVCYGGRQTGLGKCEEWNDMGGIYKPKSRGRRGHTPNVPRSAYRDVYERYTSGQECAKSISDDYGILPSSVRSLVKRCRLNPALMGAE